MMAELAVALSIGRRLKLLRVARGLRQRDVALAAGLSPSVLSLIEGDWRPPRDGDVERILQALGANERDLEVFPCTHAEARP